ncbi:MAG: hypothetical protein ACOY4T_14335 [Pseudomonadota bacterium]
MRQLLLAAALIAVPVTGFALVEMTLNPPIQAAAADAPPLGDLTPFQTIAADIRSIAATGDLAAAEVRAKDLETAWDKAAPTLRPVNAAAWGAVDDAADGLFRSLRGGTPTAAGVEAALTALDAALRDPVRATAPGGAVLVAGIAVTDDTGRALPCEVMLGTLRDGLAAKAPTGAAATRVADLQARALERCNADDDRNADAFTAQALALVKG